MLNKKYYLVTKDFKIQITQEQADEFFKQLDEKGLLRIYRFKKLSEKNHNTFVHLYGFNKWRVYELHIEVYF